MGRKALPANVHLLRGNPSKKPVADLVDGLQPEVETPGFPQHLWPEAKKEWKRISVELERYGLISKLDRAALALYCQSWARWVWAEKRLAEHMDLCATQAAEAAARGEEWKGGDGMTVPTPNGHVTYSPHWVIANKAMQQVQQYLADFGMSPSTRSKVAPSSVRQRALFEEDEEQDGEQGGYGSL